MSKPHFAADGRVWCDDVLVTIINPHFPDAMTWS
jgi:hypothetical protein